MSPWRCLYAGGAQLKTDVEARIAPFNATSNKLRRDCGLIAEWIEVGEVTTCDPTEAHLSRWP